MRSGTIIALVVSFFVGIASTIAAIAWYQVARENIALNAENSALNSALASARVDAEIAIQNHKQAKQSLENNAVTIRALNTKITTLESESRDFDREINKERLAWLAETEEERSAWREETEAKLAQAKATFERSVAAERQRSRGQDDQSSASRQRIADLEAELRELRGLPEVRAALFRIENRKAADKQDARKIKFWVYKKEVITETPAEKRVINTDYVVVFDTDGDGVFSTQGEHRRDGNRISPGSVTLSEYELHRTGHVLPERMGQIQR